jgi:RNA polymerase sigma-70 factor (ECF subfamily)
MNERQFRELYERHAGPLLRYIYRFTGSREAAEEVLHDVFMQVFNCKFDSSENSNLKAWLYTTARNRSLNLVRARPALEVEAVSEVESEDPTESRLSWLQSVEPRLPAELKETWELRKQGLDYGAIAEKLSVPVGTVKSRFHRLVRFLRKELSHEA